MHTCAHAHTHTHKHSEYTKLNLHSLKWAAKRDLRCMKTAAGPVGSFQIPFLGFCPLSIAQKIPVWHGVPFLFQCNGETNSSSRFGLKITILWKSMRARFYFHRSGATDCKARGSDLMEKILPYGLKITVPLSCFGKF